MEIKKVLDFISKPLGKLSLEYTIAPDRLYTLMDWGVNSESGNMDLNTRSTSSRLDCN